MRKHKTFLTIVFFMAISSSGMGYISWLKAWGVKLSHFLGLKCHLPIHFSFRFKSLPLQAEMTIHYLSMKEDNLFDRDDGIGSNFWKFYLVRMSFTLGEWVSLVKMFRLFRLERIVLVFTVWTQYVDVQYWQGQRVYHALFQGTLELARYGRAHLI
jgi:hypothetical protein